MYISALNFNYVCGSLSKDDHLGQVKSLQNIGNQIIEDLDSIAFAIKYWASQKPEIDLIDLVDNHGVPNLETIKENYKIAIFKQTNSSLDFNEITSDLRWKLGIFRILGGFIRIVAGTTDLLINPQINKKSEKLFDKEDADEFNEGFKAILVKMSLELMSMVADGINAFGDTSTQTQSKYITDFIAKRFMEICVKFLDDLEELVTKLNFLKETLSHTFDKIKISKNMLKELLKLPPQELFSASNVKLMTFLIYQMQNQFNQYQMELLRESLETDDHEL